MMRSFFTRDEDGNRQDHRRTDAGCGYCIGSNVQFQRNHQRGKKCADREKDTSKTGQAQSGQTGAAAGSSTSVAQVEDAAAYKDGTYYGSGTGFGGPLKVMVEISGGKIASIQIVENSDGSDYISKAASLIDSIITTQSTNVDTVSGATYSSVGIIQAVRDALGQAAVNGTSDSTQNNNSNSNNNSSSDDDSSTVTGTVPYKEGDLLRNSRGLQRRCIRCSRDPGKDDQSNPDHRKLR